MRLEQFLSNALLLLSTAAPIEAVVMEGSRLSKPSQLLGLVKLVVG